MINENLENFVRSLFANIANNGSNKHLSYEVQGIIANVIQEIVNKDFFEKTILSKLTDISFIKDNKELEVSLLEFGDIEHEEFRIWSSGYGGCLLYKDPNFHDIYRHRLIKISSAIGWDNKLAKSLDAINKGLEWLLKDLHDKLNLELIKTITCNKSNKYLYSNFKENGVTDILINSDRIKNIENKEDFTFHIMPPHVLDNVIGIKKDSLYLSTVIEKYDDFGLKISVDDQFTARSNKFGFFGSMKVGLAVAENNSIFIAE